MIAPATPAVRMAWLGLLVCAACGGQTRGPTLARPGPTPALSVPPTGLWRLSASQTLEDGDLESVTEDWSIEQHGRALSGHYDRVVTRTASDGRVYVCNRGDSM